MHMKYYCTVRYLYYRVTCNVSFLKQTKNGICGHVQSFCFNLKHKQIPTTEFGLPVPLCLTTMVSLSYGTHCSCITVPKLKNPRSYIS